MHTSVGSRQHTPPYTTCGASWRRLSPARCFGVQWRVMLPLDRHDNHHSSAGVCMHAILATSRQRSCPPCASAVCKVCMCVAYDDTHPLGDLSCHPLSHAVYDPHASKLLGRPHMSLPLCRCTTAVAPALGRVVCMLQLPLHYTAGCI